MSEEYAGEWICDFKGNVIHVNKLNKIKKKYYS
jgi:hypothetical protein